jgi:hypothetical protein
VDVRMYNRLLRHVRALGERAAAELKQRWRALQYVTLSPSRIPSGLLLIRQVGVASRGCR